MGVKFHLRLLLLFVKIFALPPLSLTANKDFLGLVQTTFFWPGSGSGWYILAQGGGSGCLAFYIGQFSAQSDIFELQTG